MATIFSRLIISCIVLFSISVTPTANDPDTRPMTVDEFYNTYKGDSLPSICTGTEAGGTLEHAKLLPFSGGNFRYFDTLSYISGHAFMSDMMRNTLLASYAELDSTVPGRIFTYMESGLAIGGPIPGHRTHQNGRSVDLMVPLMKDSLPYYGLDQIGGSHYSLEFDDQGRWLSDSTIAIDFNLIAKQILSLDRNARKNELHVKKVILKIELKDDFYATPLGKKVKAKGIYMAMNLPDGTNRQHDDHFHVDFEPLP